MKQFKFFRGTKKDKLSVLDLESLGATASIVEVGDQRMAFVELRSQNNNEMEQWYMDHPQTVEDVKFYDPTPLTIKPTLWMRIKMFWDKIKLYLIYS